MDAQGLTECLAVEHASVLAGLLRVEMTVFRILVAQVYVAHVILLTLASVFYV